MVQHKRNNDDLYHSVTPIFGLSIQERYLSIKAYNADPISRICSLPLKQSFLIYRHEFIHNLCLQIILSDHPDVPHVLNSPFFLV